MRRGNLLFKFLSCPLTNTLIWLGKITHFAHFSIDLNNKSLFTFGKAKDSETESTVLVSALRAGRKEGDFSYRLPSHIR